MFTTLFHTIGCLFFVNGVTAIAITILDISQFSEKVTQQWIDKTPPTYVAWNNWYSQKVLKIREHPSLEFDRTLEYDQPHIGKYPLALFSGHLF